MVQQQQPHQKNHRIPAVVTTGGSGRNLTGNALSLLNSHHVRNPDLHESVAAFLGAARGDEHELGCCFGIFARGLEHAFQGGRLRKHTTQKKKEKAVDFARVCMKGQAVVRIAQGRRKKTCRGNNKYNGTACQAPWLSCQLNRPCASISKKHADGFVTCSLTLRAIFLKNSGPTSPLDLEGGAG